MNIKEHLNRNNLHHAYLIEGIREEIMPEVLEFIETLGVKTLANPDFYNISLDSFKIEDARNLKSAEYEKSFSLGKKIFLISSNNFLLEAQNVLLKMFEEPIKNTHFFIIVPDASRLLKTFVSRFYLISTKQNLRKELMEAEKFVNSPLKSRIDFIKELLIEEENDNSREKGEDIFLNSPRLKALKFLDALEVVLSRDAFNKNMSRTVLDTKTDFFRQIFKVREFLNQPGSSAKSLMESVALIAPNF